MCAGRRLHGIWRYAIAVLIRWANRDSRPHDSSSRRSYLFNVQAYVTLNISVWGIHVTKWLGTGSLVLFLAPHKVRFFRISLFIPNGFCSNKAQSTCTRKIKLIELFCDLVSYSRTLEECFCCQSGLLGQCTWILTKNILRMFSRIRLDCRIALTSPERA